MVRLVQIAGQPYSTYFGPGPNRMPSVRSANWLKRKRPMTKMAIRAVVVHIAIAVALCIRWKRLCNTPSARNHPIRNRPNIGMDRRIRMAVVMHKWVNWSRDCCFLSLCSTSLNCFWKWIAIEFIGCFFIVFVRILSADPAIFVYSYIWIWCNNSCVFFFLLRVLVQYYHTVTAVRRIDHAKSPMTKMMDLFRHRSNSATSEADKRKAVK